MRSAIAIIRGEHRGFATALHALQRYLKPVLEHRFRPNQELFATVLSYVDTFMDRFHHPKEDEHLFRALRGRTDRADGVLLELQHDHAIGPAMLREIHEALARTRGGSEAEVETFAQLLQRYVSVQEAHMRKEEGVVMAIARETLTDTDWETIDAAFRDHRDPLFGTGPDGRMGYLFRQARENIPT